MGRAHRPPPVPLAAFKRSYFYGEGTMEAECVQFCVQIWGIEAAVYLGLLTELSCYTIYDIIE